MSFATSVSRLSASVDGAAPNTSSTAFVMPLDPSQASAASDDPNGDPRLQTWASAATGEKAKKAGTTRTVHTPGVVVLSSLGGRYAKLKDGCARKREAVRTSVGAAVKELKDLEGFDDVCVDAAEDPHAAAVAAHLARYEFTLKTMPKPSPFDPNLKDVKQYPFGLEPMTTSTKWVEGAVYAEAQNLARTLMELPANMLTPTKFCERVTAEFAGLPNVEIVVRDEAWAEEKGMRTFLSVTRGTSEPAKVLEIHYKGAASPDAQPLALVGKGITFDSGGISLKAGAGMKLMRGDMGGAAAVVSSLLAIAKLKLPVNIVAVTPLTENMPGPSATKPGDIIYAMNGKTVEVDNTDAEGRLILADAIYYASSTFKPHSLIDVATLTGAMEVSLGEVFTGVFTTSDSLWTELHTAGEHEWDRFWRMPLDDAYGPQIHGSNADLCNTGGRPAGSCTAALFLQSFVDGLKSEDAAEDADDGIRWAHIDIAGTMEATRPTAYQEKGMTGRPVRALVEYVKRASSS